MMASGARSSVPTKLSKGVNTKLVLSLSLWYFISIFYNIFNKRALNALKMHWLVATIQMGLAFVLIPPMWFFQLRTIPFDSLVSLIETMGFMKEVVVYQTITHVAGVVAVGSGAVSFAHVIKSMEPICFDIYDLFQAVFAFEVLLIVDCGRCWSGHGLYGRTFLFMAQSLVRSCILCIRCSKDGIRQATDVWCIAVEWTKLLTLGAAIQKGGVYMKSSGYKDGIINMFLIALCYYLYNELSFRVLGEVAPVTHAVANTLERIFIIFSPIFFFQTPITRFGLIGSHSWIIFVLFA